MLCAGIICVLLFVLVGASQDGNQGSLNSSSVNQGAKKSLGSCFKGIRDCFFPPRKAEEFEGTHNAPKSPIPRCQKYSSRHTRQQVRDLIYRLRTPETDTTRYLESKPGQLGKKAMQGNFELSPTYRRDSMQRIAVRPATSHYSPGQARAHADPRPGKGEATHTPASSPNPKVTNSGLSGTFGKFILPYDQPFPNSPMQTIPVELLTKPNGAVYRLSRQAPVSNITAVILSDPEYEHVINCDTVFDVGQACKSSAKSQCQPLNVVGLMHTCGMGTICADHECRDEAEVVRDAKKLCNTTIRDGDCDFKDAIGQSLSETLIKSEQSELIPVDCIDVCASVPKKNRTLKLNCVDGLSALTGNEFISFSNVTTDQAGNKSAFESTCLCSDEVWNFTGCTTSNRCTIATDTQCHLNELCTCSTSGCNEYEFASLDAELLTMLSTVENCDLENRCKENESIRLSKNSDQMMNEHLEHTPAMTLGVESHNHGLKTTTRYDDGAGVGTLESTTIWEGLSDFSNVEEANNVSAFSSTAITRTAARPRKSNKSSLASEITTAVQSAEYSHTIASKSAKVVSSTDDHLNLDDNHKTHMLATRVDNSQTLPLARLSVEATVNETVSNRLELTGDHGMLPRRRRVAVSPDNLDIRKSVACSSRPKSDTGERKGCFQMEDIQSPRPSPPIRSSRSRGAGGVSHGRALPFESQMRLERDPREPGISRDDWPGLPGSVEDSRNLRISNLESV